MAARKSITYPAFLPDQLARNILTTAENVYPAADGGYRAVASYTPVSTALPETFQGGAAFVSSAGTAYLLAGTATKLQQLTGGTWSSLLTGLSAPNRWKFAQFGDHVVAVNGSATQDVNLTAGTAAALAAAPTGTGVATVGDFVVITEADGNNQLVKWSAFNDHTAWTPAVNQSGFQPMLTGGDIKGIAGGEYGVILQRFRLVRMELSGDATAPFNFSEITPNFGCASSGSIAQAGRTIFFFSDRGFVALDDGTALRPIGNEKFDQSFRDSVSSDAYETIWSAVDPKRSLVFWGFAGSPGRIWVYNWVLDRASTLSLPNNGFFAGYSSSLTLEQVSALYPDLDAMPYSLDDPRFQGGDPRLYFVGPDNSIGALSGPKLAATLAMGQVEIAGERLSIIRGAWPISDATDGTTITVTARQRMGDDGVTTSSGSMQPSGRAPLRCKGRYIQLVHKVAEGTDWTFVQGVELELEPGGLRGG